MSAEIPIEHLPRTSSITIAKLKKLNILTFLDLLHYFPIRYQTNENPVSISTLYPSLSNQVITSSSEGVTGVNKTVSGTVIKVENVYTKYGKKIQRAILDDHTGSIELIWFNQLYITSVLKIGMHIQAVGKVDVSKNGPQMYVQEFEHIDDQKKVIHTAHITAYYSEKLGISSKTIREKLNLILSNYTKTIDETLPADLCAKYDLAGLNYAYKNIHQPQTLKDLLSAKRRLSFDELFVLHYATQKIKKEWQEETTGEPFIMTDKIQSQMDTFEQQLPFVLTQDQKKAYSDIIADMKKKTPMNRLLLGEVGSGKTVVSALAAYFAYLNSYKTLVMAPTEILAKQHFATIQRLFGDKVPVQLITGSEKSGNKDAPIVIGTHALLFKSVSTENIGLIVVDEQQKFGVAQRAELKKRALVPHLLTMTATPIPRTVLLSWYGYLSTSTIRQLPKFRKAIKSYFVPKAKRSNAYDWISKQLTEHKTQAFIVCPLIDISEHESLKDVKAVTTEYEHIKNDIFPTFNVGLLHGKMKSVQKEKLMTDFGNGIIDILVSTPVVEVGIDFPNASIILIEAAERYGLAQLHQLRGRVGRGTKQSYCLLFTEKENKEIQQRLLFFASCNSGEQLAEYDLKHRGAGEVFGTRQHGFSDLTIAELSDTKLLAEAKESALRLFTDNTRLHPLLEKRIDRLTSQSVSPD